MHNLKPSMRLKAKGDTFFLPNPNGGVYFRNNRVSFRMEGGSVDQWIEKLIPMLNGEHSMEELTKGLTAPYRERVYEIADSLYRNGFVRDVSEDRRHRLPDAVMDKYAAQIEFLDNLGGSGAYRFQTYREAKVLAVGSGPIMVSLASALFESGLPRFHLLITDSLPTNRERIAELAAYARRTDPDVTVEEITRNNIEGTSRWREAVHPFDAVMYVSEEVDVGELRTLHAICKEEGKVLLPAVCLQQTGMAGPLVHPACDGCWESAWRRVHRTTISKDPQRHTFSSTAGAMLANALVFEWFKTVTGVAEPRELGNKLFMLDLETLEGSWHPFKPHPRVTGRVEAEVVQDFDSRLRRSADGSGTNAGLLPYFGTLTSPETGIFHIWDEEDLLQLPLSQCRVQAVDPAAEGPAGLLPDIVCNGLTHEEARRDAGLSGIEAYVSQLAGPLVAQLPSYRERFFGVGAGESLAKAVSRGLCQCLTGELHKGLKERKPAIRPIRAATLEDKRCRYFWQALTTLQGAPVIGLGEEVSGLPVAWVGSGGRWFGGAGLNVTLALRQALQQALLVAQNGTASRSAQIMEVSSVQFDERAPLTGVTVPSSEESEQPELLRSAIQVLRRNGKRLLILDLAMEPFLKEGLAGVYGVLMSEEVER